MESMGDVGSFHEAIFTSNGSASQDGTFSHSTRFGNGDFEED